MVKDARFYYIMYYCLGEVQNFVDVMKYCYPQEAIRLNLQSN